LETAGFVNVQITVKAESKEVIKHWIPGSNAEEYVQSANITAMKP